MRSKLVLSVGLTHELETAFNRNGWTLNEVAQLCEGDTLARLREVLGGTTSSRYLAQAPRPRQPRGEVLLPREKTILTYLMQGYSNKLLARVLGNTEAAVKTQVKSLMRKIGVANRTQAAIWAMSMEKEIRHASKLGGKFAPIVRQIQYHRESDQLELATGWCTLLVDRKHIEELRDLSPAAMESIYLSAEGIHLDAADIDINATGLIAAWAHELAEAVNGSA